MKDFLTRNQVPFRWLELERDAEAARLLAANGGDEEHLPLVITDAGRTLQAPSTAEVADALGLSSTPSLPFYDLIVIGGGPAGLGAAVYGASEGLRTVLVEREAIGGQAGQSSRIENYLGFPSGIAGGDLARRATTQARRFGAEMLLTSEVASLEVCGSARVVRSGERRRAVGSRGAADDGCRLPAARRPPASTALAGAASTTGRRRPKRSPSEDEDVYIVGGANSAGQAAVFFARTARSVTIMVRGAEPRALDVALPDPADRRTSERAGAHLCRSRGRERERPPRTAADRRPTTGTEEEVEASWLFVFIGAAPCTDWLGKEVLRDENGFVLTGPDLLDRRAAPGRLAARTPAVLPGDQRPGGIRGRRRARSIGQAGGVGRRRGRHGRHARSPLPGAVVSAEPVNG